MKPENADGFPARQAPGRVNAWVLGMCGAGVGAGIGVMLFAFALSQGFYAMALPGALLGLGAGWASRIRSVPLGIVCGVLGLLIGILCEWRYYPFVADKSLVYFVSNLHDLKPVTIAMIVLGGVFAFWFGRGR